MQRMVRVVALDGRGGPEVLRLEERSLGAPRPDEVAVDVIAAGVNRADILQRRGRYPAPPGTTAEVLGLEFSGVVSELGRRVDGVSVGDHVMGLVPGGAMAERIHLPARELLPVPQNVDMVSAAAIPEAFATAYDGLVLAGGLAPGETVLLHAVASGIGTAALQLAQAQGANVAGTTRSADKLEACRALGLANAIVPEAGRFADSVRAAVGPVDLVFDPVGAAYFAENLAVLSERGRLVVYGLLGGAQVELPLGTLMQKRLRVVGTVLRSRPPTERAALVAVMRSHVLPLFAAGRLKPVVTVVLPMEQVADAHRLLEGNGTTGKVVLTWGRGAPE